MKNSNNKKSKNENEQSQNSTGINSEQIVLNKFKNWKSDEYAQKTLVKMGYNLKNIKNVVAYIAQDKDGNRKVKLKVYLKQNSATQEATNSFIEQIKDKISSNKYAKDIFDTLIQLKDKILSKIRK